jgi:hypothetical protein
MHIESIPRCECVRKAMIAPTNVIQTNNHRAASSELVMPVSNA